MLKRALIAAGIVVWFAAIAVAFALVWHYKRTPGDQATPPASWPTESTIARATDKLTLVMFAHPQCPCTRASMAELARLAVDLGDRAQIDVVLVRPPGTKPGFEEGAVAERAAAIPGARVIVDDGGVEADRFRAVTSGTTVVYTAAGRLAFNGGLTSARGHEGQTVAYATIVELAHGAAADHLAQSPTFGCALGDEKTASR